MWDELEHYTTYRPACVKDTIEYKKHVESIQIFEFFASLNSGYEQMQVLFLGNDLLPSLNEVYAHIHREGRCGMMNLSPSLPLPDLPRWKEHGGRSWDRPWRSQHWSFVCLD